MKSRFGGCHYNILADSDFATYQSMCTKSAYNHVYLILIYKIWTKFWNFQKRKVVIISAENFNLTPTLAGGLCEEKRPSGQYWILCPLIISTFSWGQKDALIFGNVLIVRICAHFGKMCLFWEVEDFASKVYSIPLNSSIGIRLFVSYFRKKFSG